MGFKALSLLLWLLTAFTLTTQELARLSVSPKVTAECGKQVTLNCNVSSSRHQLSIKHMGWFHNKTSLCSVDSGGKVTRHHKHHCEYRDGLLSLILQKVQPLGRGDYMCKLKSNMGALHESTRVELQECSGSVDGVWTSHGPRCIFNNVYPDGDVHWFQGPHNLSDGITEKSVNGAGWLTIRSELSRENWDAPYNCSLKSTKSGRYIASTLVAKAESRATHQAHGGVGSQGPLRTFWCIPIFLVVTLK